MTNIIKRPEGGNSLSKIVQAQEIQLNPQQTAVISAAEKPKIRDLGAQEVKEKVLEMLPFIKQDIGLQGTLSQYEQARAFDMVYRYYKDLTVTDIKVAFELLIIGDLDPYLPLGKGNQPDRNHYQEFSAAYITKVLTAYRRYKGTVIHDVRALLPAPEVQISEEQKQANKDKLIESVVISWYVVHDGRQPDPLRLSFVILDWLESKDLITSQEISEAARNQAYVDLQSSSRNAIEKKKIREDYTNNIKSQILDLTAKRKEQYARACEWLKTIETQEDLINALRK